MYAKLPYGAINALPPREDAFDGVDVGLEVENNAQLLEAGHQPNRLSCDFPVLCQPLLIIKMDRKRVYVLPWDMVFQEGRRITAEEAFADIRLVVDHLAKEAL